VLVIHPPRSQSWAGIELPWWLVWLVVATAVALAFKRRFGVTL
jgi:hypothetical protein